MVSLLSGRAGVSGHAEGRNAERLAGDRLPVAGHQYAGAQGVPRGVSGEVQDHPRLGSVVGYATMKSIAAMLKSQLDRRGEDAGRNEEPDGRKPVRQDHLARAGQPVDDGCLRWPPGAKGRQGRDGQLALRGRQDVQPTDEEVKRCARDSSTFPGRPAPDRDPKCVRLRACSAARIPIGSGGPGSSGLRKIGDAPAPSFVHLRLHSEYSIVDSTLRIADAVKLAGR